MRRRLVSSILGVTILAVVLFGFPLGLVVQRFVDEQAALRLERHAVLASRQVPTDFATNPDPVELPTADGITYGLYDRRGNRVAGQGPPRGDTLVAAALGNQIRQGEQGEARVAAIPIVDLEMVVGAMRASQPTTFTDRRAQRAVVLLVVLAVGVVAVGGVLARIVAGRLARPVKDLRDQAVRLGEGDFAITATPTGVPELDDAAVALVTTAKRLEDLMRRERAFSADASHQLRTPLAALRTNMETELQFPRASGSVVLTEALEDIARLEGTIDQLLAFARDSAIHDATTDVGLLLEGLRSQWNGPLARDGRPLVVLWPQEELRVEGSGAVLRQALDTIVDNAVAHGAGEVRIEARSTDGSVSISVTDQGQGFPSQPGEIGPEVTDATHGFGLSLAQRLLAADRGRLVIAHRGPNPVIELVLRRDGGVSDP